MFQARAAGARAAFYTRGSKGQRRRLSKVEPIEYLEFEIEIKQGRDGEYPVTVISAAGQAQEMMRLPFDPQALESELEALRATLRPTEGGRPKKESMPGQEAQEFGQALFDALFRGEVRALYNTSRYQAAEEGKLLRLALGIEPQELAPLPWESLYDAQFAEYVCHATPVVRKIPAPESDQSSITTPPLRILGMIVNPGDGPTPTAEDEKQHLEEATSHLQALELVELEWVEGQSARDLVQALTRKEWHVFHLIGDGGLERNTGEGFVIVDDDTGQSRRLSATQLRWLLAKCKSLQLVWLNACESARGDRPDRFTNTATLLVQKGIPAVLSAQLGTNSPAAEAFAEAFYAALAASMPLDLATTKGRMAIHMERSDTPSWGAPVLHAHSPDLQLFERQAVMATAQRRGDEALSGDDFERALTQYTLAVEMGAEPAVQDKRDLAEAARQTVKATEDILGSPEAKVESQTDAVIKAISDLEKLEEQLPASPVVQALLLRAREELPGLRDRLWQEGQELLEIRTIGLTLEQRCRRMEDCVRLLEKARRLSPQENLPLEEDLAKARRRLVYLENAQARAKSERGRRLLILGFIIVFVIAALIALYFVLQMLPLSDLFGGAPTAIPAMANHATTVPATEAIASTVEIATANPTAPGASAAGSATTATTVATEVATTTATNAAPTASPQPTNSATATQTLSPQATATDAPTATAAPPSDTPTPAARQANPTSTPTASPTETPTPGIIYPAPVLVQPDDHALLTQGGGSQHTLRWTWDGTLQPGEWFDVRVWTAGMPHYGIAWTKEPLYWIDICLLESREYNWSIAVIRGEDGVWLGDLSPETAPRQFTVSRSDLWCQLRDR
jgi:hypothetical protein